MRGVAKGGQDLLARQAVRVLDALNGLPRAEVGDDGRNVNAGARQAGLAEPPSTAINFFA